MSRKAGLVGVALGAIVVLGFAAALALASSPGPGAARTATPRFVPGACPSLALKLIPVLRRARCYWTVMETLCAFIRERAALDST
jgi:hypothetical protein